MRKSLMTPQEIQRTMDFILRSNADSVIRMERFEEEFGAWNAEFKEDFQELKEELREVAADIRAITKANPGKQRQFSTSSSQSLCNQSARLGTPSA